MSSRGRALAAVAAVAAALTVSACGGDDQGFEPRPPVPAQISVQVADDTLTVSPAEFGAGTASFTIVNLGEEPTAIEIDGPTAAETEEIVPGTSTELKMEMETGDYEAIAAGVGAEPFAFRVGPERESSSNDLLLP